MTTGKDDFQMGPNGLPWPDGGLVDYSGITLGSTANINQLEQKDEPAKRYDAGKLRFDLLPGDGIEELVKVFTYGAGKYADRNWELGMSWSRCLASLFRHLWAFYFKRESIDPESGCHHMAHATWNALALVVYDLRKVGKDDRPN